MTTTLYSWNCEECGAEGKRWFKLWHSGKQSPFNGAGVHADKCKGKRGKFSNYRDEHPHKNCPNHMITSKTK